MLSEYRSIFINLGLLLQLLRRVLRCERVCHVQLIYLVVAGKDIVNQCLNKVPVALGQVLKVSQVPLMGTCPPVCCVLCFFLHPLQEFELILKVIITLRESILLGPCQVSPELQRLVSHPHARVVGACIVVVLPS